MARISGVDIPSGKRIEIGLTYLYGVGKALSGKILRDADIDPSIKAKDLTDDQVLRIRDVLKEYLTEGDLRKEISQNIKRLKDINSYRGNRHRKNLPCRGQRTRTNARTKRGMRKTVGGKKQEEKRG
ncbi:30S ribosomal protein S13 [candidate division WOR-1 bacterium RIFOXYA2_FULL_36_21]|uniref:Small ribosomal subunit protein uS13 n=1 Tax=candidate division WOR-1 bacterium RIFOXYB2_FULL_36_35 TaxID=1802578 RepID=A0A1F4S538_UNCSA|nr:MAG: 30S ribosomal protein S13 [candidate division WOR-1 bacterium RIFOXYA2_FULL_36_21]OGC15509.1 MAG: 30S ribosomal protein S13 [candidate division WOR-1 bacterium RIFOXYB2_FULL_36_35]OGC21294.1 MAG: 30S ribosomal protein S13 [candidate division WOR-1 bacterium RIFOXYA12_FULL_36_13]